MMAHKATAARKSACVIVLGDIGRSPRMQYHCQSLAQLGHSVDLIAYGGSKPGAEFERNKRIRQHLMNDPPAFSEYVPRLLAYVLKVLWQILTLFWLLFKVHKPQHILVQNPPSIPTLFVVWFYTRFTRSKFVIDWHNYGHTILALSLPATHPIVRFARWFEHFFGSRSDANFCVTKAMQRDLHYNCGISATVLYDKPAKQFRKGSLKSKHEVISKLKDTYSDVLRHPTDENGTVVTEQQQAGPGSGKTVVVDRPGRPALIISSTSWTEDENFEILLNALNIYDRYPSNLARVLPDVICFITGKGPQKEHYAAVIQNQKRAWKHVRVILPWLEAEDYPKLLAACDLGICLHTSSSQLDLPMKVVDMFGCALPVCAVSYQCLNELVKPNTNGMIFTSSQELADQLVQLLRQFPTKAKLLKQFSRQLEEDFGVNNRWDKNWLEHAAPVFR